MATGGNANGGGSSTNASSYSSSGGSGGSSGKVGASGEGSSSSGGIEYTYSKSGLVANPAVSSVVYLSDGSGPGGATIVLDQAAAAVSARKHFGLSTHDIDVLREEEFVLREESALFLRLACKFN